MANVEFMRSLISKLLLFYIACFPGDTQYTESDYIRGLANRLANGDKVLAKTLMETVKRKNTYMEKLENIAKFDIDTSSIRDIISCYNYGMFDLPQRDFKMNLTDGILNLINMYGEYSNTGDCLGLAEKAVHDILEKHSNYFVARATGHDEIFFTGLGSTHNFLLVYNEPMMDMGMYIYNKKKIEEIIALDPFLVDPSFGVIKKFSDTGYSINSLYAEYAPSFKVDSIGLRAGESVPLGMNSKDEIVSLKFSPKLNHGKISYLGIEYTSLDGTYTYDLMSSDAINKLENRGLVPVMQFIRNIVRRDLVRD